MSVLLVGWLRGVRAVTAGAGEVTSRASPVSRSDRDQADSERPSSFNGALIKSTDLSCHRLTKWG